MRAPPDAGRDDAFAQLVNTAEKPGGYLVTVPLTNSELPAVVERDVYHGLISQGLPARWYYEEAKAGYGYVKAHMPGKGDVLIALSLIHI